MIGKYKLHLEIVLDFYSIPILGEIQNGLVDLSVTNFSVRDENICKQIASDGRSICMTPLWLILCKYT